MTTVLPLIGQATVTPVPFKICIPSNGRPERLCRETLTFLHRQGVDQDLIYVFVDPLDTVHRPGTPEHGTLELPWYQLYLTTHGFAGVHVLPGGPTLSAQYVCAWNHFGPNSYVIHTSDGVPGMLQKTSESDGRDSLTPISEGTLTALIAHGFHMLERTHARAWSTCASLNPRGLHMYHISQKCGLLDGNMTGEIIGHPYELPFRLSSCITDVEHTCRLLERDGKVLRYMMFTTTHEYRGRQGGHARRFTDNAARVREVHLAIEALEKEFPHLIQYTPDKVCSDKNMPYRFTSIGPQPLELPTRVGPAGRPLTYGIAPSTGTERARRSRHLAKKSLKRPASAHGTETHVSSSADGTVAST